MDDKLDNHTSYTLLILSINPETYTLIKPHSRTQEHIQRHLPLTPLQFQPIMAALYNHPSFQAINATDLHALAIYYQTHPVPQSFNAGVVVASILVSVLGAATSLLLLGRRTATSGFRNWALLFLAAVTMASV